MTGSTSGTTVLGVLPLIDPLASLETVDATRAIASDVLIGVSVLVAGAFIFGPEFCGWICPLGLLIELNQDLRRMVLRLVRIQPKPPTGPLPSWVCYCMFGGVIGFAAISGQPLFQILSPINLLVRGILFVAGPGPIVVAAILVVEHVWPRMWCRILCPLGAFYGLAGRFGLFRIRIKTEDCLRNPCRMCTRSRPMGIRVMEDYVAKLKSSVDHPSCTRCGNCADRCPQDLVSLGFSPKVTIRHSDHKHGETRQVARCVRVCSPVRAKTHRFSWRSVGLDSSGL